MVNKYLEKLAAIIPRAGKLASKAGASAINSLKDLTGKGPRAKRLSDAKTKAVNAGHDYVNAKNTEHLIKARVGEKNHQFSTSVGNAEAKSFKARKEAESSKTRAERASKAYRMANKRTAITLGVATSGAAGVGAAALTKKDK